MIRSLHFLAVAAWIGTPSPGAAQTRPPDPLFTIGSEDGSAGEMLSRIGGVAIDRHGRVIVLDVGENRLVVFRPSGERLQYIGRKGAGPGEFLSPMALAVTASGRLLVVDPQTSRLTEYNAAAADSVRHVRDWAITVRGYELCTAGERIFLLGESEGRLIHEITLASNRASVRSFAEPKSHHRFASTPNIRPLLRLGSLACAPNGGFVGFVPKLLGEIRILRTEGQEQLFARLTPFQEIGVTLIARGHRFDYSAGVFQQNVTLVVDDRGAATVEIVTLRSMDKRAPFVETYEFRMLTPTGETRAVALAHARLAAVSSTRLACTRDEPYPHVLVYDRGQLGSALCP